MQITYNGGGAIEKKTGVHLLAGTETAYTLADPTAAEEGMVLTVQATNGSEFTLAATFNAGGGSSDSALFGEQGDCLVLRATGLKWNVESNQGCTIS